MHAFFVAFDSMMSYVPSVEKPALFAMLYLCLTVVVFAGMITPCLLVLDAVSAPLLWQC